MPNKINSISQSPKPTNLNRHMEIKLEFKFLQVGSEQFLEDLLPESDDEQEDTETIDSTEHVGSKKQKLVRAYVQLYGLNQIQNSKANLIGKCKCSVSLNAKRTSRGSLSGLTMPKIPNKKCEIKFQMVPNAPFSNYLIRIYFRKTTKIVHLSPSKLDYLSKKSNGTKTRRGTKSNRASAKCDDKKFKKTKTKIKQLFTLFSFNASKNKHDTKDLWAKELVNKIDFPIPELNLQNNSIYTLEARQLPSKYNAFLEDMISNEEMNGEDSDENDDTDIEIIEESNGNMLQDSGNNNNNNKINENGNGKRWRKSKIPEDLPQINSSIDRLISQFVNNKQSALLKFAFKLNEKACTINDNDS